MIPAEYKGKSFIQIAPRLRWKVPGDEVESFRPINDLTGNVTGDPPVIAFADNAEADVVRWLAQGRIRLAPANAKPSPPLTDAEAHAKPPKVPPEPAETGGV